MSNAVNKAIIAFYSTNDSNVLSIEKLLAAVKAAKIRTSKAFRPLAMAAASKHYDVAIVKMDNGKDKLDSGDKPAEKTRYKTASRAMNRAIAKVFPKPATNPHADPVAPLVKKFKSLSAAEQRKFLKNIGV